MTPLAGFIDSNFSPLLAEVAGRALSRCDPPSLPGTITAIVMVTALGDVTSAARVAAAVDAGQRVSPLQFFQSVPNAVAGYLAARSHLTGPVVCVSGMAAGLEIAVNTQNFSSNRAGVRAGDADDADSSPARRCGDRGDGVL